MLLLKLSLESNIVGHVSTDSEMRKRASNPRIPKDQEDQFRGARKPYVSEEEFARALEVAVAGVSLGGSVASSSGLTSKQSSETELGTNLEGREAITAGEGIQRVEAWLRNHHLFEEDGSYDNTLSFTSNGERQHFCEMLREIKKAQQRKYTITSGGDGFNEHIWIGKNVHHSEDEDEADHEGCGYKNDKNGGEDKDNEHHTVSDECAPLK